MCWSASARHPGQSGPSTMSYSFPASPRHLRPLSRPDAAAAARAAEPCARSAVPAGAGRAPPGPGARAQRSAGLLLSPRQAVSSRLEGPGAHRERGQGPAAARGPPGERGRSPAASAGLPLPAGTGRGEPPPAACPQRARRVSRGERAPAPPRSHRLLSSSPRICFHFFTFRS